MKKLKVFTLILIFVLLAGLQNISAEEKRDKSDSMHACPKELKKGSIQSGEIDKTERNFKVITYNIWNGFDWGKDTVRRANLQLWMQNQMPDVVALQELCNYTPEKLDEDAKS